MFKYKQINCLPPTDFGAWRTSVYRTLLYYEKPRKYKKFIEEKQLEVGYCYLYLFMTGY
jgi:hypothetical protein